MKGERDKEVLKKGEWRNFYCWSKLTPLLIANILVSGGVQGRDRKQQEIKGKEA